MPSSPATSFHAVQVGGGTGPVKQVGHSRAGRGREKGLTEQVQEDCATVLSVGVGSEINVLGAELLQKLTGCAGKLHTHPLDPVAQLWADCLHNGNSAILIQVHLGHCSA